MSVGDVVVPFDLAHFPAWMRAQRLAQRKGRQDLALPLHVSVTLISLYESGDRPIPVDRVPDICAALGYRLVVTLEPLPPA